MNLASDRRPDMRSREISLGPCQAGIRSADHFTRSLRTGRIMLTGRAGAPIVAVSMLFCFFFFVSKLGKRGIEALFCFGLSQIYLLHSELSVQEIVASGKLHPVCHACYRIGTSGESLGDRMTLPNEKI